MKMFIYNIDLNYIHNKVLGKCQNLCKGNLIANKSQAPDWAIIATKKIRSSPI